MGQQLGDYPHAQKTLIEMWRKQLSVEGKSCGTGLLNKRGYWSHSCHRKRGYCSYVDLVVTPAGGETVGVSSEMLVNMKIDSKKIPQVFVANIIDPVILGMEKV